MDIYGFTAALSEHPESQLEFLACEQSHPSDVLKILGWINYTNIDKNISESQEKKVDIFYNFSIFIES